MVTIWGTKEFQVLSDSSFQMFSIIRTICLTCSIILIFLSVLYTILLIVALATYINLVGIYDSCCRGIVVGMVFGYYGLWFYICLSCVFPNEKALFLKVGSESKPGPDAQYRSNGEPIFNNQGNAYIPNQELRNPSTVLVYNNNDANFYNENQEIRNPSRVQVYNNNQANLNFNNRNRGIREPSGVQVLNNNKPNFNNRNQQLQNPSTVEIYNNNDFKTDEKYLNSHGTGPEEYLTINGVLYKRVDKPNNNNVNINVNNNRDRLGRNNIRNNLMRNQRRIGNPNDDKNQNSKAEFM